MAAHAYECLHLSVVDDFVAEVRAVEELGALAPADVVKAAPSREGAPFLQCRRVAVGGTSGFDDWPVEHVKVVGG